MDQLPIITTQVDCVDCGTHFFCNISYIDPLNSLQNCQMLDSRKEVIGKFVLEGYNTNQNEAKLLYYVGLVQAVSDILDL